MERLFDCGFEPNFKQPAREYKWSLDPYQKRLISVAAMSKKALQGLVGCGDIDRQQDKRKKLTALSTSGGGSEHDALELHYREKVSNSCTARNYLYH